ncbi:hypothetical protein U1Q18_016292 [Sarracenia purpurea var. burkii]
MGMEDMENAKENCPPETFRAPSLSSQNKDDSNDIADINGKVEPESEESVMNGSKLAAEDEKEHKNHHTSIEDYENDDLKQSLECDIVDTSEENALENEFSVGSAMKVDNLEHQKEEINQVSQPRAEVSGDSIKIDPSKTLQEAKVNRGLIDTTAPFDSVKSAVSMFGGIVDWKAHKVQTVKRRKLIDQEIEEAENEIPIYKEQSQAAEEAKMQVLKELDNTKRLIEELKLKLEREQTEEQQAKQDSELAKLQVEEMEQGITNESRVAAKAQLEVAQARHAVAVSELKTVRDELEELRKDYDLVVIEKELAIKRAAEAVFVSKEVEKTVEELKNKLIGTKESLESANAAHLDAEEQRTGAAMAKEKDTINLEKELKEAEEELKRLNQQALSAKDLKTKLNTALALLWDLKTELATYLESSLKHENSNGELEVTGKKAHTDIKAAAALAKNELEEVKLNIEKSSAEANSLKVAATSLKSEIESEKSTVAAIRQKEGMASVAIVSLESELRKTLSEIEIVQREERETKEKMAELNKQIQEATQEAERATSLARIANKELCKAKEEAEQAKAAASSMESRLLTARGEIEASKGLDKLSLLAIDVQSTNDEDSQSGVTLSLEEYYELNKRAHDAEELANVRVAAAISQTEVAKESELRSLKKLEEVSREMVAQKEALDIAVQKAEKAKEGKLGVEQELRKWRAEHEQRRKAGESGRGLVNQTKSPRTSVEEKKEMKIFVQMPEIPILVHHRSSPKANISGSIAAPKSPTGIKVSKKKKSFFPRIFMFLIRKKKAQAAKVM